MPIQGGHPCEDLLSDSYNLPARRVTDVEGHVGELGHLPAAPWACGVHGRFNLFSETTVV